MTISSKYQSLISALLDATAEETQGQVPVSKMAEV